MPGFKLHDTAELPPETTIAHEQSRAPLRQLGGRAIACITGYDYFKLFVGGGFKSAGLAAFETARFDDLEARVLPAEGGIAGE